ncbi:Homoserine dehydrogenase [Microbotryomycetes sp. JL221]|nr:Homoserine dehydrogenase [Microbotryomycetes sp. JL221]
MARPGPLARDLAFLVLMAGAFTLPAMQQRQLTSVRELLRFVARAGIVAGGTVGALVIGGGVLLAGERAYDHISDWLAGARPPPSPSINDDELEQDGNDPALWDDDAGGAAGRSDPVDVDLLRVAVLVDSLFERVAVPPQPTIMSTQKAAVAIVGVGLVGKQVVHQLSSPALRKLFDIVSLSNSKHTVSISPNSSAVDAQTLLSLLPSSSSPLPTSSTHPGTSYSSANPSELVKTLAANARSSKTATILVDCTSDLSVTELYPTAIASGLSVVTPNKKGFSSSDSLWQQILEAQSAPGAGLVYLEATVGAGLPIISTLRDLLKTDDEINKIEGVFSGTLSYIFNEFSKPGGSGASGPKFSEIVKVAKENGYTEPHPADDLSGSDVARKLTILSRLISANPSTKKALPSFPEGFASLATDTLIPSALSNVASGEEFVAKLPEHDDEFDKLRSEAEAEGKALRYVGVIDRDSGVVKCSLEKYPASHPFAASLSGSDNIIAFHTSRYSARPLIVQGSGAGADVTAMGVVADVIKVAERYGVRVHL